MNNVKKLKGLFLEIVWEAERNTEFAQRLGKILGESAPSMVQKRRPHRRAPGVLDPFAEFKRGEIELRARLEELDVEHLKDIIAEHGMDASKLAMKWKGKDRLMNLIIATVRDRIRKGDAFRTPEASRPRDGS